MIRHPDHTRVRVIDPHNVFPGSPRAWLLGRTGTVVSHAQLGYALIKLDAPAPPDAFERLFIDIWDHNLALIEDDNEALE